MSNLVYPLVPGLTFDRKRAPIFSTGIQTAASGAELRTSYYAYPLWQYELSYDVLRDVLGERAKLEDFFLLHRGAWDSWLFNDPFDQAFSTPQAFGTGNGSTTQFQLVRNHNTFSSGNSFDEPIKNLNGAPSIYDNGFATSAYTINATGLVTFTTAPAAGHALTWAGSFFYRCRFLDDQMDFNNFAYQLWELGTVKFRTVKQ